MCVLRFTMSLLITCVLRFAVSGLNMSVLNVSSACILLVSSACILLVSSAWVLIASNASVSIVSETVIVNRVFLPVAMVTFPAVETLQPVGFTSHPYIARSQIKILTAHQADIFVPIPNISLWNHNWFRVSHLHWSRTDNDDRLKRHPPIRGQHAAGYHHQPSGRQRQHTPTRNFCFHTLTIREQRHSHHGVNTPVV